MVMLEVMILMVLMDAPEELPLTEANLADEICASRCASLVSHCCCDSFSITSHLGKEVYDSAKKLLTPV
jgi:hypothetical protein